MADLLDNGMRSMDRAIVRTMGACLRLMMQDLRSRYNHVVFETERLEKAGIAVDHIYRQLYSDRKGVNGSYGQMHPDRSVRRTGLRPAASGYVPDAHPAKAVATPVAHQAAYQKTDDKASFRSAR